MADSAPATASPACPLCQGPGGRLLWQDDRLRVVAVDDADYPGFVRVIVADHVAEMTDLPAATRRRIMALLWAIERAQRDALEVDKINVASLGNHVPHVHWHSIPRWRDDAHFPGSVWSARQRTVPPAVLAERRRLADGFEARLAQSLADDPPA